MNEPVSIEQLDKKIKKQKLGFMINLCCVLLLAMLTVLRYFSADDSWWITGIAFVFCTAALKSNHKFWQKTVNLKQDRIAASKKQSRRNG
ncbi:hypothetical protein C9I98_14615 [Photobacterium sanctipauli]|uniref:Uncharacterized protein n=1 Tax=Photobacterium sanctipauli TaxID=1342794 RepID=A0A2T3NR26_9GAMM|nr:hypothetical protein [Photobacterium sanctipauli]PSW18705.1 hypothetical protein C9I98_14615 [Photobacterium sanctipauli]